MKGVWAVHDAAAHAGPSLPLLTASTPEDGPLQPGVQPSAAAQTSPDPVMPDAYGSPATTAESGPIKQEPDSNGSIPQQQQQANDASPSQAQATVAPSAPVNAVDTHGGQDGTAAVATSNDEQQQQQQQQAGSGEDPTDPMDEDTQPDSQPVKSHLEKLPVASADPAGPATISRQLQLQPQPLPDGNSTIPAAASVAPAGWVAGKVPGEGPPSGSKEAASSSPAAASTHAASPGIPGSEQAPAEKEAAVPAASRPAAARPKKRRKLYHAYMLLSSGDSENHLVGETKVVHTGEQLSSLDPSQVWLSTCRVDAPSICHLCHQILAAFLLVFDLSMSADGLSHSRDQVAACIREPALCGAYSFRICEQNNTSEAPLPRGLPFICCICYRFAAADK